MVLYYESGYNTMFPSRHAAAQSGYNLNLGHVGYAHQHAPAQCGPSDFSYASDPGLQQTGWPTIYGSSVPPRNHAAPGFEPNFKFEDAWSSILPSSSVSSPLSVATTPQTYNPLGRSSGSGLPGPCLDSYSTYNNNRVTCNAIIGGNAAMNGASSHHGNPHLHSAAADNGSRQNRGPYEWMKKSPITGDDLSPGQGYKPGKTRTKDKYRVVYSDHQRLELEKEFHYSRYITIRRKAELAQALQLSERQVKIWFQNRRAKERKTNKKKDEIVSKNIGDQHQQVAVASHAQLHTQHHHHL